MTERNQKREPNGQYAFDGNLDRMCVCGHTLGNHSCGTPADCLMYSLPENERVQYPGGDWTDDQVVNFAEIQYPCGTINGWHIRREGSTMLAGSPERAKCAQDKNCVHIMLDA